jgi:acetyl-CoA acyltransferase
MGGWKVVPNYEVAKAHPDWYWGMGLTAEAVAKEYNISREDQDKFEFESHQKAIIAIVEKRFEEQIVPIKITENYLNEKEKISTREIVVDTDEGPRADTNLEALAKLKPVFSAIGSVTAGNSSQTSDGASFLMVMSEAMVKEYNLEPIARLVDYAVAGVPPRIMGIGPIEAIPKVCKQAGLKIEDIDLFELNEAFAAQVLSCTRSLGIEDFDSRLNPNGGAIALGHPLGMSGARLLISAAKELKLKNLNYALITMCIGVGQGYAMIIKKV